MIRSNRDLLKQNLEEYLSIHGLEKNLNLYKFVLKIDKSDTKDLSTNLEKIINFWILPKKVNQILGAEEVIDIMVTGQNEIPIWVGIELDDNIIKLTICKRFRKLEVVKEWHCNNKQLPYIPANELKSTEYFKEFKFAYPAAMLDDQKLLCEEFEEIVNIMNLGSINYNELEKSIWENVENPNADILKYNSKDTDNEYLLIDLWNCDQISVMNLYFRAVGANIDFVTRSLLRWNDRLWGDLGPKIKEIEDIYNQEYVVERNIIEIICEDVV